MKKYISLLFASALMCSCVDTIILPDDRTVEEDFWKTKSDVALMVNGAYKSMLSSDVMQRLIVWGDFRSDELVKDATLTSGTMYTNLSQIQTGNVTNTNSYADWSSFYSVINNCNLVLDKAGAVRDIDPAYTDGDYLADCSQMKALRALCYFYLVRTFRDVPYSATAYTSSSQERDLSQTAPAEVLANCIKDLEEALPNALAADAYSDWRRVGYINRDAMRAILADIYLWRASMTHSESDYQQCVSYCDQVLESKKTQNVYLMDGRNQGASLEESDSLLIKGAEAFRDLYVTQNSRESILELQFNGNNNSNTGLCQLLYKYGTNATTGYMKASGIFDGASTGVTDENGEVYMSYYDYRRLNNVYALASSTTGTYTVRKMIASVSNSVTPNAASTEYANNESRAYSRFKQNYILYRVPDVMLMKAEALVQLAPDDANSQDPYISQALSLCQQVFRRSMVEANRTLIGSSLYKASNYDTKEKMETAVLRERLIELCFEGKRWYDLVRYNYRHMDNVADITKTLGQLNEEGFAFANNYDAMLTLVARKDASTSTALKAKMKTEPYLYMPVIKSQIKANPNLVQNPVYNDSENSEKK